MSGSDKATPENDDKTITGNQRIKSLTGIRWVAALAVFLSHTLVGPNVSPGITVVTQKGYFGVTLFFILSGFILTITYLKTFEKVSFSVISNFFIARFARIYPLYLFCLLAAISFNFLINKTVPSYFFEHLLAVQSWSGSTEVAFGLNGPGWSIGVELFLYMVFPIIIVFFMGIWKSIYKSWAVFIFCSLVMLAIALMFSAAGLDQLSDDDPNSAHRWLYRMPLMRLGDFLLGVSLGSVFLAITQRPNLPKPQIKLVTPFAIIASVAVVILVPIGKAYSWDVSMAIPFSLLLFAIAINPNSIFARWLSTKHMVFLGEVSFAFYLSHVLVAQAVNILLGDNINFWVIFILKFFLTLCVSIVLYKFVEVPSRVLIRNKFNFRSRK